MPKTEPKRVRIEGMDSSPPQERIAILIRDESDINTIEEVFGGAFLQSINPVTSTDPRAMKDLLLLENTPPLRSCFIIVESTKLEEELLTKSSSTVYQELLITANRIVGKNIFSHYSLHTRRYTQRFRKGAKRSRFPCLNLKPICFKPIFTCRACRNFTRHLLTKTMKLNL